MLNPIRQFLVAVLLLGLVTGSPAPARQAEDIPADSQHAADSSGSLLTTVESDFQHSLTRIQPVLERYGYPAIAAAVMVEGIGIPAPGQTMLMAGALEAAAGQFSLGAVLTVVLLATVLGNSLGYLLGRWGGRALLDRVGVNERHWQKMEALYGRYGGGVVLFGRFVDGLRQLNGLVAGMLDMPWWTFTVYNVIGAVLWTGLWGLAAYFLDKDFHVIADTLEQVKPLAAGLSLAAFLGLLGYLLWRRRRGKAPDGTGG